MILGEKKISFPAVAATLVRVHLPNVAPKGRCLSTFLKLFILTVEDKTLHKNVLLCDSGFFFWN